jgi:glyoxylate reductase
VKRVVLTARLPLDLAAVLGAGFEVVWPGGGPEGEMGAGPGAGSGPAREDEVHALPASRDAVLAALPTACALVPIPSFRVDSAVLERAPSLLVVAAYSVGTDNIDVAACTRRGVVVANTPDVLTDATADLTMALLLAAARRVVEGDKAVRAHAWPGFAPSFGLGLDLSGATLGVVGLGRIGRAVARRAAAFGMRVVYTGRPGGRPGGTVAGNPVEIAPGAVAEPRTLDALLAESDVVSLHCALTAATRDLLSRDRLAQMKRGAILVNTARGALLDEEALAEALRAGHLSAAALDVYRSEPHVAPALLNAPNTVLTPHIGSAARSTRRRMAELCAEAIAAASSGHAPAHALNPEVVARW